MGWSLTSEVVDLKIGLDVFFFLYYWKDWLVGIIQLLPSIGMITIPNLLDITVRTRRNNFNLISLHLS